MSLEPASVLVAGGTDERQLLVDYDTMEVIGAAPDDPNTLIISVAAAMPGGPSEVVLATVDANDRLLMDSPVLNRLAELATQVADVRATQEALGVTDEVIAAAAAAEEQSMAEIQAIAEEEEQRVEERADQTPEPGQPEQPAASTEPAPVAATESTAAAAAAPAPAATPEPAPAAQAEQQPAAAESTPAAAAESTPAAAAESTPAATVESTPAAAAAPESTPAAAAAEPATAAAPHDLAPEPGAAEAAALAEAQPAAAHAGQPDLGAEASAAAATGSAQATSGAAAVGRDYAAIESAIFAQSPIDIYSIEDGTTATRYETVSWTPVSARAEIADRDGWRLLAGLTVNGVACGEHDLTILAANGTYYLYVTNSALDTINAAVAGGSSEGQSTGDEYDYDAVETYLFGQAPVYVYNSADPSDTPRSYNRVEAAPVYRAMLPDSSGWILTTALSIGGTDCGTHDITVVLSGENYYLYAPQDALDAIDTALRQAGGADEAEPDDAQDAYGLHGAEEAEQLPHEVGTAATDAR